jgi:predicted deacetylase
MNPNPSSRPTERPALCVAIHDVAPATWPECVHLLHAVRAVADIPISWLLVPRFHGSGVRSLASERTLGRLLEDGHELVLHGYTHRDETAAYAGLGQRLLRTVYTEREGEFAALTAGEARRRLELGLAWFAERGWPVSGFVAPAWLLGPQVWPLLPDYGFCYTTTFAHFHVLRPAASLLAPALVYAARNRVGRAVSPPLDTLAAALWGKAPLLRLALHPRDARYPTLVRHAQRLLEKLLATHEPQTKDAFARRFAGLPTRDPTFLPRPSASGHSPHNNEDSHSVRHPPWR